MQAKRKARVAAKNTRERLLDTAERLFAKNGIRATSLREITQQTRINIAAVNYHFRSKEDLVRAVFERSFRPLNEERLLSLDAAESAAGGAPLSLDALLRALFEPMLRLWQKNKNFIYLSGRLQNEPDARIHKYILDLYEVMIRRFLAAANRAIPGAAETDILFWLHFFFGGMVHTLLAAEDLKRMTSGKSPLEDLDRLLDHLIAISSAGLRAIPVEPVPAADAAVGNKTEECPQNSLHV